MAKTKTPRKPKNASVVNTVRRRAEEALGESEERFSALAHVAFEGIIIHEDCTILYANEALGTMLGCEVADLIGTQALAFVALQSHDAVLQHLSLAVMEPYEVVALRRDGSTFAAELCGKALSSDGSMLKVTAVRDITKRKQAEEALRESEERFRLLAEHAQDMIFRYRMTEPYGFEYASPAVTTIAGYTPQQFYVDPGFANKVIHPDDLEAFEQMVSELRTDPVELRWVCRDGSVIWTEQRNVPIYDDSGALVALEGIVRDITERKRAEEALRESEERYRTLLESTSDSVYVVDREWRLVVANEAAERFVAMPKEKLLSGSLIELFPGIEETAFFRTFERVMSTREPDVIVDEYTFADGRKGWYEVHVDPVPEGILCISRNITERKRAEEALRENEEKFRTLAETMPAATFIVRGTNLEYVNSAAEAMVGYTRDELLAMSFWDMMHPECQELLRDWGLARQQGEGEPGPGRYEAKFLTKSGEERWVDMTADAIELDGKPAVLGTAHDITERKRAEEALRQSEERFRSLVESINEVIYEVDADGRITYASPRVEEMGGYSASEVIGRPFTSFVHPDDVPRVLEGLQATVGGHLGPIEFRLLTKSGEVRWGRVFSRPVFEGDRIVGLRGVLTDITQLKRAEEVLQEAREQLEAKVERQLAAGGGYGLSFRELSVLHLIAEGKSDKEIAQVLGIRPLTASKHVTNILSKMNAVSRTDAGVRAVREGLIS